MFETWQTNTTDKAETSFKNESSQTWSLDHFSCRKLSVASGGHLDAGCGWVHYPGGFAASQQTGSPGLPEDHAAGGRHHRRHSVQSQTRSNGESVSAGMRLMYRRLILYLTILTFVSEFRLYISHFWLSEFISLNSDFIFHNSDFISHKSDFYLTILTFFWIYISEFWFHISQFGLYISQFRFVLWILS